MDFDQCPEFYAEDFPSFVSPEYNIDELEEILRSTDANLSSGLGYSFQVPSGECFQTYPSPPTSSNSHGDNIKSECDSPTDFNPDDFINFLSDEDGEIKSIKSENRSTPSPTNSSSSAISRDSMSQSMMVDSALVSSPTNVFQLPANILPVTTNSTPINLLQGTLIPVQTVPLTALQVQSFKAPPKICPKPPQPTNAATKPKTIVLSSKDFKALMQKIQNGKGSDTKMPKIIMKTAATPIPHTKPSMLPKVLPAIPAGKPEQNPVINLGLFKGIVDEKHLKKQQRMIKNRESASLSRRKKKEYVVSLETRINDLEKENTTLKGENTTLRSQLIAFAQSCQCNHNKLSEFISNKFNSNIIGNNCPKSSNFKSRLLTSNMKKNTAVLLAMVFMVSINFGNFQTYFSQDDRLQSSGVDFEASLQKAVGRRGLLWVDEISKWNVTSDSIEILANHTNSVDIDDKCPVSINQTENLRLASELRKWIGVNDFLNLSTPNVQPVGFKLTPDFFELKSISLPLSNSMKPGYKRNRKNFFNRQALRNKKIQEHPKNSLQIFKPQIEEEYVKLFEGIKRRDDTFYVLSFNSDHILLPAAAYNKSSRPRMSLMLPAGDASINGDIILMQIDCEVVNTTEVQLKPDMIPLNLRSKYKMNSPSSREVLNKTGGGPVQRSVRNAVENTIEDKGKINQIYRPYFMTPYAAQRQANFENTSGQHVGKRERASRGSRIRGADNFSLHPDSGDFLPSTHILVH